jgi:hypothetical protein
MNSKVSSTQYSKLSSSALSAIADLNSLSRRVEDIIASARELGVSITIGDKESEMQFLARIAAESTERSHDLQKREALDNIAAIQRGEHTSTPQSWLGRKLNNLSRIAG